jgi:Flp pilus assembly protein TadG
MHRPLRIRGHREPSSRQGSIAVIAGVSFTLLVGLAAVSVDLGRARVIKTNLQYIADAAAHAAVSPLDGTSDGIATANTVINGVVSQTQVYGITPTVDQVETGYYETSTGWHSTTDPAQVKAVKVTLSAQVSYVALSRAAFGTTMLTPRAMGGAGKEQFISETSAENPAGEVECYIPIAIPSCVIDTMMANNTPSVTGTWQPSTSNNVAWADDNGNPNASTLNAQINALSGGCSGGATMEVGGNVYLNNGMITSVAQTIGSFLNTKATEKWNTSEWGTIPARSSNSAVTAARYGHIISGPMVVFQDTNYCSGGGSGPLNGTKQITGFVYAAVYDVVAQGGNKNVKIYIANPENFTGDEVADFMGGDNGAVEGTTSGTMYNVSFATEEGGGVSGIPL